jgi:hypothetical protein
MESTMAQPVPIAGAPLAQPSTPKSVSSWLDEGAPPPQMTEYATPMGLLRSFPVEHAPGPQTPLETHRGRRGSMGSLRPCTALGIVVVIVVIVGGIVCVLRGLGLNVGQVSGESGDVLGGVVVLDENVDLLGAGLECGVVAVAGLADGLCGVLGGLLLGRPGRRPTRSGTADRFRRRPGRPLRR